MTGAGGSGGVPSPDFEVLWRPRPDAEWRSMLVYGDQATAEALARRRVAHLGRGAEAKVRAYGAGGPVCHLRATSGGQVVPVRE